MIVRLLTDDIKPYKCSPPLHSDETVEMSEAFGRVLIKSGKATEGQLEQLESCCFDAGEIMLVLNRTVEYRVVLITYK